MAANIFKKDGSIHVVPTHYETEKEAKNAGWLKLYPAAYGRVHHTIYIDKPKRHTLRMVHKDAAH